LYTFESGEHFGYNASNYRNIKDKGFVQYIKLKNFFIGEGLYNYSVRLDSFENPNKTSRTVCIDLFFIFNSQFKQLTKYKNSTTDVKSIHNSTDVFNSFESKIPSHLDSKLLNTSFELYTDSTLFKNNENVLNPEFSMNVTSKNKLVTASNKFRLFYKYLTLFNSRLFELKILEKKEPKLIFLLRFLNAVVINIFYKNRITDDQFSFFTFVFPAIFFYFIVVTIKKIYKFSKSALFAKIFFFNTFKIDTLLKNIYSLLLELDQDLKLRSQFLKRIFYLLNKFIYNYICSFKSYSAQQRFYSKYDKLLNFLIKALTNSVIIKFFKNSANLFLKSSSSASIVFNELQGLQKRGSFILKIHSLSLSPTLRSYVSTLTDYYTNESTFFSKLTDQDLLTWIKNGTNTSFKHEDTNLETLQCLNELNLLKKKFLNYKEPFVLQKNDNLNKIMLLGFTFGLEAHEINLFERVGLGLNKANFGRVNLDRSLEIETYLTDFEDSDVDDTFITNEDDFDEDLNDEMQQGFIDEEELIGDADLRNEFDADFRDMYPYNDLFFEHDVANDGVDYEEKDITNFLVNEDGDQSQYYDRPDRLLYMFDTFVTYIDVVLRSYFITLYKYYLANPIKIKNMNVRFSQVLKETRIDKKKIVHDNNFLNEYFNVKFNLNKSILIKYDERSPLNDVDHYIQPDHDYEEHDGPFADIHQTENNVSTFDVIGYNTIKQSSSFDYNVLNFTFLEIKRTNSRIMKMLSNELYFVNTDSFFQKNNVTLIKYVNGRFFWLELELNLIEKIFNLYYNGFFFSKIDFQKLIFSNKGSFRLLKFIILRVRLFLVRKLKNKKKFFNELNRVTKHNDRMLFIMNYLRVNNVVIDWDTTLLISHYLNSLETNSYYSALDIFDLLKILKIATYLKGLFGSNLTSFGYIQLTQELLWFISNFPNLKNSDLKLKVLEYLKLIRIEEQVMFRNLYSLIQIYSKYGLGESYYFVESRVKNIHFHTQLEKAVPKSIIFLVFFRDLLLLLLLFFIIIYLSSEYTGFSVVGEIYFQDTQDYEEPYEVDELTLSVFPDSNRARKREFMQEFYDYFVRIW
jgi:hypothetical protein